MSDVAIVDYGINNVRSVRNAVEYCGFNPVVTHEADAIADASHVILPGVGAFGDAMANIRARGIDEMLERHVRDKGKPFLAVCLGMQLLAKTSEEHADDGVLHRGLGWFDADVVRYWKRQAIANAGPSAAEPRSVPGLSAAHRRTVSGHRDQARGLAVAVLAEYDPAGPADA